MTPLATPVEDSAALQLPPIILHPFSEPGGPQSLLESSRASLMMQGLLPPGTRSADELSRKLLAGRFSEIRMLFYIGKDLTRWLDQCMEIAERHPELLPAGVRRQSFVDLLLDHAPAEVEQKLRQWGVADYRAIFSRALALNTVFSQVPARAAVTPEFLQNYFRYADQIFVAMRQLEPYATLSRAQFHFDLYSSAEYTRLLESAWEQTA